MKRVIIVAVFLFGLCVLDRGIGAIMQSGFSKIRSGELGGQINEALEQRDSKIIVFGSSLAKYHVAPTVITEISGDSCFNAGCNGQDIYYAKLLQSLLLQDEIETKTFIYILNWSDLYRADIERAKVFAPFVDDSQDVRELLCRSGTWESLKYQSHAYRYNSIGVSIVRHLLKPESKGDAGFFGMETDYIENPDDTAEMKRAANIESLDQLIDTKLLAHKLRLYDEFVLAAKRADIATVLVIPPTYREGGYPMGAKERLARFHFTQLAERHSIELINLDETNVDEFQNVEYFGDQRHLNARGAEIFSSKLAAQLKTLKTATAILQPSSPIEPMLTNISDRN